MGPSSRVVLLASVIAAADAFLPGVNVRRDRVRSDVCSSRMCAGPASKPLRREVLGSAAATVSALLLPLQVQRCPMLSVRPPVSLSACLPVSLSACLPVCLPVTRAREALLQSAEAKKGGGKGDGVTALSGADPADKAKLEAAVKNILDLEEALNDPEQVSNRAGIHCVLPAGHKEVTTV